MKQQKLPDEIQNHIDSIKANKPVVQSIHYVIYVMMGLGNPTNKLTLEGLCKREGAREVLAYLSSFLAEVPPQKGKKSKLIKI